MIAFRIRMALLASAMPVSALPATAQTTPAPATPVTAPAAKSSYTAADFARFAPRTAYDMVIQVPGFTVRSASVTERGLGQASENILINGQRIANKSGGALDQLQRTNAASVERIDIVEAAQLGIAGLSGQVANVILKTAKTGSGQFEYRPEFRAHYSRPYYGRGNASYSDKLGPFDYTLGISNQGGHGAYGGPAIIRSADGELIEERRQALQSNFDPIRLSVASKIDGWGSSEGNVTLAWTPYWYDFRDRDRRTRADGDDRTRLTRQKQVGYIMDLSGDYEFALGPGRLKLIGLRKFEHEPTVTTQVTTFDSGADEEGVKFVRDARIGETIARGEYGMDKWGGSWEVSLERAFNRLEQEGELYFLQPSGEFEQVDFPEGSGIVEEVRYEGLLTWSRKLSDRLDLQLVGGGEISRLDRVDGDLPPRKFFRPKGSLTLGWRPAPWEVSLKLNRRVGQISFYDFLAQPKLSEDRENSGNPDLVPPQSWEAELEAGRSLGRWGKSRLRAYVHRITDIIDIIPIGEDGAGIGNLPSARRAGLEWISTFNLDPVGFTGAKLDLTLGAQRTRVRDPLTGEQRPISGSSLRWARFELRHDVPRSPLAWGVSGNHSKSNRTFYLSEVDRVWEGPWFVSVFAEHKAVAGMTVRASVGNILNARHRQERLVYDGRRNEAPLLTRQSNDQLIGPIFSLGIRGNF